jgi:putative transposase
VNRDFHATAPNEKWLTDISEFQIPAGKVYLSPMIDCFDGMVVSWSIGTNPNAELVNTMLDSAVETVTTGDKRPIVLMRIPDYPRCATFTTQPDLSQYPELFDERTWP